MADVKARPGLLKRTPVLEWIASGLGLVLTVAMVGFLVREALVEGDGPPALTVAAEAPVATEGGFVVPFAVRNASPTTAAAVDVVGSLQRDGRVLEERRFSFTYVPGGGEARGGLIFQNDPATGELSIRPEGYEEP